MFPSRNLFTFENGMNITSNFDSGNLLKCTKGNAFEEVPGEKYFNKPNDKDEMFYAFDMWVCPDAWPYMTEVTAGWAGFFFAITGFPEAQRKFDD